MIARITNYALVILFGLLVFQTYRLKNKSKEVMSLEIQLQMAADANTDNTDTIYKLEQANNQCVTDKAANSKAAESNLNEYQSRVAQISSDYDQISKELERLKGTPALSRCAYMRVDDSVIELLQTTHNLQDKDG